MPNLSQISRRHYSVVTAAPDGVSLAKRPGRHPNVRSSGKSGHVALICKPTQLTQCGRAPVLGSHPPVSGKAVIRSASALPEFRVDDDLDLGCRDAPTALVDQRNSKSLTIHRRAERERRSAISDPF